MTIQAGSIPEKLKTEQSAGVFLTLEDLETLFPLLKKNEAHLTVKERHLFIKIEKKLYENLSIGELERFMGGSIEYS